MMRSESGTDQMKECPIWPGEVVHVEPTAEKVIALSHIEVRYDLFFPFLFFFEDFLYFFPSLIIHAIF